MHALVSCGFSREYSSTVKTAVIVPPIMNCKTRGAAKCCTPYCQGPEAIWNLYAHDAIVQKPAISQECEGSRNDKVKDTPQSRFLNWELLKIVSAQCVHPKSMGSDNARIVVVK